MGVYGGPKQQRINVDLNANNSVSFSLSNFPNVDNYKIKVDGFLALSTSNNTGIVTVSPGLTRNISIEAYSGLNLQFTTNKNVKIFDYVGIAQSWTTPENTKYLFADVQGAQGGGSGGAGGRAKSYISVASSETLYFYCGGAGGNSVSVGCTSIAPDYRLGGFNGGGDGGGKSDAYACSVGQTTYTRGTSGGGASDIRRISGDLSSRIIVAGGGGGSYGTGGGAGGGENGVDGGYNIGGPWTSSVRGGGATISNPGLGGTSAAGVPYYGKNGLLGIGGTGARFAQYGDAGGSAGGGGGGYYGGGGGGAGSNYGAGGGGGGGSGYIDDGFKSLISSSGFGSITSGYRSGNGRILIAWDSTSPYSDIVTNGLLLNLDAQNYYSYPGSGTTWTDLSGNGNNGTLTNGPTYNSSNGGSIVFDGVDDYSTSGALPGSFASFTVITWFYPTVVASYNNVLDCNSGYYTSGNVGPRLEMNSIGNLSWVYSNNTTDNSQFYFHSVISSGLVANTWHCAAITYNGGTNTSITYYNGNSTGLTRTLNLTPTGFVGALNNLNIGRGFFNSRYFQGNIAQASVYNRALTAAEIQQNYNATKSRFGL